MPPNPGRTITGLPGFFYDSSMARRTLSLIFALSLVALISLASAFLIITQPAEVGDVASVEASLSDWPATTPPAPLPTSGDSSGDSRPLSPTVPIRSGVLTEASASDGIVPVTLKVGSIEVDAPIVPTGVNQRTGQMAVPGNVRDVAWYQFGSRPGESGSAVLAAHVDLASRGPGVFFNLRNVDAGDLVEIGFSDGSVRVFRVEARTIYGKEELPLDTIFAKEGSPVVTLITCGGGFSESSGSYDSNVVVYAVPVSQPDHESAG